MSRLADVRVVSPVAWFPLMSGLRSASGPNEELQNGVKVYRPRFLCIPKILKSLDGRLYTLSLKNWINPLIEQWRPDIIDAHFIWPDGVGAAGLASSLEIPYSITLRGKIYPSLEDASQRKQCVAALQKADLVISVDDRMAQLARDFGVDSKRIEVIPNGVDIQRFRDGDQASARKELGLPERERLVLTVAHLGKRKGHHEMIEALAHLPDDVSLVLVGGASVSGEDEKQLRDIARQHQVAHRLVFAGKQPHHQVHRFYQAADLTVLASWREGCPNTVLESLACGTPVVATDVGSVNSMIHDGVNGHVVPIRDVKRLSNAIASMLDQPPSSETVRRSKAVRPWQSVGKDVLSRFAQTLQTSSLRADARDNPIVETNLGAESCVKPSDTRPNS